MYADSLNRIEGQALSFNIFDNIYSYSGNDLEKIMDKDR
jgi:hypothetical protein